MKVNFETAKVQDFYWLSNKQVNNGPHTGPTKWSTCKSMPVHAKQWEKNFISIKQVSRENKLRDFHFKFLHRIVVTKKELHRFHIKDKSEYLYCGEQDLIEHTFSDCFLRKISCQKWCNGSTTVISLLSHHQIKNIYLGFFPILPIKNWKNLTTPCFLLTILSIQISYTIILFSSQILSAKSPLSTG